MSAGALAAPAASSVVDDGVAVDDRDADLLVAAREFWVRFVKADGVECNEPLAAVSVARFESGRQVRGPHFARRQRNFPSWWWRATSGDHLWFESWVERDQIMALDFDRSVVGLATQPFWLSWTDESGRRHRHAPDLFARRRDGTGLVIDVRLDDQITPADASVFATTAAACRSVGWQYRRVGGLGAVLATNLRWLAGYRHPRCCHPGRAAELRAAFAQPGALLTTATAVGDPIAVLPTLFHLLWRGVLTMDMTSAPLDSSSRIALADAVARRVGS
jgi:hypothetical protein